MTDHAHFQERSDALAEVERLRKQQAESLESVRLAWAEVARLRGEAVDRIALTIDQTAEVERLRKALEWIESFTSSRGDARMMDAGQARAHIHRRAKVTLSDLTADRQEDR